MLFEAKGEMDYKGPKDIESLEFFVHDRLNTDTKKVMNLLNSVMEYLCLIELIFFN